MTILLLVITIPLYSYLYWRLIPNPYFGILLLVPFVLVATFVMKNINRWHRHFIYFSMAFITYLTLFTLIRDLLSFSPLPQISVFWILVSSLLVITLGYLHALMGPHVKNVSLSIENLHPDLENFKIAQISDLHVGPTIRKNYVTKVVTKTKGLDADLLVFTGDIGDGHAHLYGEDMSPFRDLRTKYGSFYVTGNHEYYWNALEWIKVIRDLNIQVLLNESQSVQVGKAELIVAGIPDPVSNQTPLIEELGKRNSNHDFSILLSHRPGVAHQAAASGYNLQLSGHTHGGQFFPWTLVVKFVHEFSRGLSRVNAMWIYVNMGTGSWGPFLRVGSTTEITCLKLLKK